MYQPETLPNALTQLSFSEQLTLWSVRYWAEAFRKGYSPYSVLKDAYRLAKAPDGMAALDAFMTILISGNSRTVDIRCLCCSGISPDEWRILQSLALTQERNPYAAAPLLSLFLDPTATRAILPVLKNWSACLTDGRHTLPVREQALDIARRNTFSPAPYTEESLPPKEESPALH